MVFLIDVLKMKFIAVILSLKVLRKNMKSSLIVSFIAILKTCDYRNRDYSKCHNRPIPTGNIGSIALASGFFSTTLSVFLYKVISPIIGSSVTF